MIKLLYGKTNTFLIPGSQGYLLIDTDRAGTLGAFYKAIKACGIGAKDITYILATHYHPDHIGLIPELTKQGVQLLLADTQTGYVHFSDAIIARDGLPFRPIDEKNAAVFACGESRPFLAALGIGGEIISTPSHSRDSISLILDDGDAIVGDLERYEYSAAYRDENTAMQADWAAINSFHPKRILYAHGPESRILPEAPGTKEEQNGIS